MLLAPVVRFLLVSYFGVEGIKIALVSYRVTTDIGIALLLMAAFWTIQLGLRSKPSHHRSMQLATEALVLLTGYLISLATNDAALCTAAAHFGMPALTTILDRTTFLFTHMNCVAGQQVIGTWFWYLLVQAAYLTIGDVYFKEPAK
ncbi:MAG: hypothetical protein WBY44_32305 [Bryobacteraceae bacterium]